MKQRQIVWLALGELCVAWALLVDALIFGDRRATPAASERPGEGWESYRDRIGEPRADSKP